MLGLLLLIDEGSRAASVAGLGGAGSTHIGRAIQMELMALEWLCVLLKRYRGA